MFNDKERYFTVNVYKVYTQDKFLVFIMFLQSNLYLLPFPYGYYKIDLLLLLHERGVTKMDKNTGSKVSFMAIHPELGRLNSLDIYADDKIDGI